MNKKVFISYAREDVDTARRLFNDLKNGHYEPWLDEKNLLAGQNWRVEIPRVIRETGYVLVLLSEKSTTKRGFVQAEQKLAAEVLDEFPENEIFLIPVRIDDCELPFRLKDLNWVDLFPKYEAGFNRILDALEAAREVPTSSSPPPAEPIPPDSTPPNSPIIYVSYAVIDNEKKWVTDFVANLASEIAQRIGSKDSFNIVMDANADSESDPPPASVLESVGEAEVFIPVVSPSYLASDRCARERHAFFRKSENRADAHILVVERLNIDEVSRPDEFRTSRPKRFWVQGPDSKTPRVLGHPTLDLARDALYLDRVVDISDELKEILKRPSEAPEKAESTEQAPDARPAVYLAEAPGDLLNLRDDMERYLEQSGFRVLPEPEIPLTNSKSFRESVKKELRDCRVFIQLLSGSPGKTRSIREGICRLQYECAQETGKIIIQWRDPRLNVADVEDPDLKTLLAGQTVMAGEFIEFKDQVIKRAGFNPQDRAVPDISPDALVFLNADRQDETYVEGVADIMDRNQVCCVLPVWEGKASDILADMENFIMNSDGVIVFYCNVNAFWVRKQLMYCRKLIYRRADPLKALAVYEGPAQKRPGFNIKIPGLKIIDCRDCLDEEKFKPFLTALGEGGQS